MRKAATEPPAPGVVRSRRVVLLGSSGATADQPSPAGGMFRSDGFARARAAAVSSGAPWFVLSAKHGLLDPDDVISPFEVQIDDQPAAYRTAWGEWVVAQLADRLQLDGVTVEVHGGVDFAQPLRQPLTRRGAVLDIPLPGMTMLHDMSLTGRYAVVYDQPVTVDLELAFAGRFPFRWNPAYGNRVGLLPRDGEAADMVWIDVPLGYAYHPVNAYDADDGTVVIDLCNYDVMFAQRNSNWANWIAGRMQKPGTVFIAVGTGHLTGPDSVQAKLAQIGVKSERIN